MKNLSGLKKGDILTRLIPYKEYCEIKEVSRNSNINKLLIFIFDGFIVNAECMFKMFKNQHKLFDVKNENNK